jgi:hypothetical protein
LFWSAMARVFTGQLLTRISASKGCSPVNDRASQLRRLHNGSRSEMANSDSRRPKV